MATVAMPDRARTLQPRHPIRQGLIAAALLFTGIGVGLLLDSGRSLSPIDESSSLGAETAVSLTPAERLALLEDMLMVEPPVAAIDTRGATYDPFLGGVVYARD